AVLLGGALFFGLTRARERLEPRVAERAPESAAPAPAPAESDRDPARPTRAPAPERSARAPSPEPAPAAVRPAALAGTLVVLDENGGEHAQEDGILALGLRGPLGTTRREVEVRG